METVLAHWRQLRPNPLNAVVRGTIDSNGIGELAESLRENEVVEPLVVCPCQNPLLPPGEGAQYMVIAGERRWRAAMALGDEAPLLPCVVRSAMGETEQLVLMGVENLQREALNPVQEARYYGELHRRGLATKEISRRTGIKVPRVKERLALLELDSRVQELIERGAIPATSERSLCKLTPDEQAELAEKMKGRSRRAIERAVQVILDRKARQAAVVRGLAEASGGNGHNGRGVALPTESKPPATITRDGLELAVRATCAACEVSQETRCEIPWEEIDAAVTGQCAKCEVRGIREACAQCPLVDMMRMFRSEVGSLERDGNGK